MINIYNTRYSVGNTVFSRVRQRSKFQGKLISSKPQVHQNVCWMAEFRAHYTFHLHITKTFTSDGPTRTPQRLN